MTFKPHKKQLTVSRNIGFLARISVLVAVFAPDTFAVIQDPDDADLKTIVYDISTQIANEQWSGQEVLSLVKMRLKFDDSVSHEPRSRITLKDRFLVVRHTDLAHGIVGDLLRCLRTDVSRSYRAELHCLSFSTDEWNRFVLEKSFNGCSNGGNGLAARMVKVSEDEVDSLRTLAAAHGEIAQRLMVVGSLVRPADLDLDVSLPDGPPGSSEPEPLSTRITASVAMMDTGSPVAVSIEGKIWRRLPGREGVGETRGGTRAEAALAGHTITDAGRWVAIAGSEYRRSGSDRQTLPVKTGRVSVLLLRVRFGLWSVREEERIPFKTLTIPVGER